MDVAVIGAGFAGIATARILLRLGLRVTVFDAMPDVGGVWSAQRSYPGLYTQSTASNCFSDFPWPADAPEFPTGQDVQNYLNSYAEAFGLMHHIQLRTKVLRAFQDSDSRWTLALTATDERGQTQPGSQVQERQFDHLVVCNGLFSEPLIPEYSGANEFAAAGGKLIHTSQLRDLDLAKGRRVAVIGFGKSALDVATALSHVSTSTAVIARRLIWKLPRVLMNVLPYQYLLLTRFGEAVFSCTKRGPVGGAFGIIRRTLMTALGWIADRQNGLSQLNLVPKGDFNTISCSNFALTTNDFFQQVRTGTISVHRDRQITSLGRTADGQPYASLNDGTLLQVDAIVAGTGWRQNASFLDEKTLSRITEATSEGPKFVLYRSIKPPSLKNIFFNGYGASMFCPLTAEASALWIASALCGQLALPPDDQQRREAMDWVQWPSSSASATGKDVPFSLGIVDALLSDLGERLSPIAYLAQWFLPLRPAAYQPLVRRVVEKLRAVRPGAFEFGSTCTAGAQIS